MLKEQLAFKQLSYQEGDYHLSFVQTEKDLEDVLKLRFEVFNLELNEGLLSSFETGKDQDEFDVICDHLILRHHKTQQVIGTYRMQTYEMAFLEKGFYSAREFHFDAIPKNYLENGVELGRACVHQEHRSLKTLYLLWKGIAYYLKHMQKRYVFGCTSLTTQDPMEGIFTKYYLQSKGYLYQPFFVSAMPGYECVPDHHLGDYKKIALSKLFRIYLNFGAKICSDPAIDRDFKTIDFLTIYDTGSLAGRSVHFFFSITDKIS